MADRSSIEWTDATWNPIRGVKGKWSCVKVSPGCQNCYAEVQNVRFKGPHYTAGADELRLDERILMEPLRWKKPRRVFVCSMTDLFEGRVRQEWVARIFAVMALAGQHTFQVLTKRPAPMREFLTWIGRSFDRLKDACPPGWAMQFHGLPLVRWPLTNVWLGVSVEDQERADERIPLLLQTPAGVRFVSAEPLLGPVDLHRGGFSLVEAVTSPAGRRYPGLDWVIVGGESGPGARPCDLAWIRSIRDQCREASVPVFVKQIGPWWFESRPLTNEEERQRIAIGAGPEVAVRMRRMIDRKGGNPSEWPKDLRVRQFPSTQGGTA